MRFGVGNFQPELTWQISTAPISVFDVVLRRIGHFKIDTRAILAATRQSHASLSESGRGTDKVPGVPRPC